MEQIFNVNNIYIKNFNYKTYNLPQNILQPIEMQANMNINVQYGIAGDNLYEVIINCTLEAKQPDNSNIYELHISQAGLFRVEGFEKEEKEQVLRIHAASILFPYLRERIYNFSGFAGLGNGMILPTVDFSNIYEMQNNQESQSNQE